MNRGGLLAGWFAPVRVQVWWLFKTPILFGLVYLVAAVTQVPIAAIPPLLARLVAAIVPVGCFACVINELSDEHDDCSAGKANTMTGRRRRYRWCWRQPGALDQRRREPSGDGAPASAGGDRPGDLDAGLGMCSILTHQADDLSNDLGSGTATLGLRRGREGLERLGRQVAFPLEIGSLPVLLWAGGGWLSLGVVLAYPLGQVTVARKREIPLRWVDGQPGTWLLLFTVSFSLVPLLLLPRLLQQSPSVWLIPPLHLLLFAPGWRAQGCFQFRGPGGALAALFA